MLPKFDVMMLSVIFALLLAVAMIEEMKPAPRQVNCEALYDLIQTDTDAALFDRACPNYFLDGDAK